MNNRELNLTQSTVCKLISAAMFHNKETFGEDVDWYAVYKEMHDQTVDGLVKDIMSELPIPKDLEKTWINNCFNIMKIGIRLRYGQAEFLSILEKAKIPYVILKGTAAAMYYPNPMLRGMGDVDVYVPPRFHENAYKLLAANGYEMEKDESHPTERQDRHVEFEKNEIRYELHYAYATINSPEEKRYIDGLLEECTGDNSSAVRIEQGGYYFYAPPTNINGIVLLEHIGHHMLRGLGFRQIVDWMMFVKSSLRDAEWENFKTMVNRAGLEKLAKTVTKMCVRYFGLSGEYSWCMDADDALVEEMLVFLFESGNFGQKMDNLNQVIRVRNRYKISLNMFRTLQATGEFNWKLYKRLPVLRPFAWIYQLFRYARQILTTPGMLKKYREGTLEVDRRAKLMNELDMYKKVR